MALAIAESERVRGITSPNPPVGCVILDAQGKAVGFGGTQPRRRPARRGHGAQGSGRRRPRAAPRSSPSNRVRTTAARRRAPTRCEKPASSTSSTRSATRTRRAVGRRGTAEGSRHHRRERPPRRPRSASGPLRAWLHYARTGRPHVTWKYAASLDGRIAAEDGTSRWISSEASRKEVHEMRAKLDAIIVGTGTVEARRPRADRQGRRRNAVAPPAVAGGRGHERPAGRGKAPAHRAAPAHARPGRGADRAGRPRGGRRAAGRWPDAGRRVPGARAGSTVCSPTSRRCCSGDGLAGGAGCGRVNHHGRCRG